MKSVDPRTQPCGAPLSTRTQSEQWSPSITRCHRLVRNALIYWRTRLPILYARILRSRRASGTLSNAFAKSIISTGLLFSAAFVVISAASRRFATQLLFGTNPCCWQMSLLTIYHHHLISHESFNDLTWHRHQRHGPIITWIDSDAFLKN